MKKSLLLVLVIFSAVLFVKCDSENTLSEGDVVTNQDSNTDENTEANNEGDGIVNEEVPEDLGNVQEESNNDMGSENENSEDNNQEVENDLLSCNNQDVIYDNNEDSPTESECAQSLNEGRIVCNTNGESFDSAGIYSGAVYEEREGVFSLGIIGGDGFDNNGDIDIRNQRGIAVTLSSINSGFDDLEVGLRYNGTNGVNLLSGGFEVICSYVKIIDCETEEGGADFSPTAFIEFSKIDRDNQLLSGTFEFIATSSETGNVYPIMDGVFTDLWYCNQGSDTGKMRVVNKAIKKVLSR